MLLKNAKQKPGSGLLFFLHCCKSPVLNDMEDKEITTFSPSNREEWRQWLVENHARQQSVWLIYYKKSANVPTITVMEAVAEALCFGWINSLARPVDEGRFMQIFGPRKPKGVWSKINKALVQQLIDAGRMTPAGFEAIQVARQNGSWNILDEVEELILPDDLSQALAYMPNAGTFFDQLSRSDKRNLLQWLVLAKTNETRQKRIKEIVELANQKLKPGILKWTKKTKQ